MRAKTGRVLTLQRLKELGACSYATDEFKELFGFSVKVTKTNAVKHWSKLNWWWAGDNLLSATRRNQFQRFYNRARKAADERYPEDYYRNIRMFSRAVAAEFARLYNLDGE